MRPRIVLELLQPERDLLRGVVHPQHLHGDLVTGRDDFAGTGDARPAHFGDVEQALDAAAKVHEGAEVAHRCDPSGEDRAGHDRFAHLRGAGALLLLEVLAPGDDDVLPAVLVLDDAERVESALRAPPGRRCGRCRSARADRRRARGRCAPRSRPSRLLHFAFHGEPGAGTRPRARAAWRRCARPCARARCRRWWRRPSPGCDRRPTPRRRRRRPSAPRGRSRPRPCRRRRRTPPSDRNATMVPSMVWPALEPARLDGRLEHRGEIFFLLAHGVTPWNGRTRNYICLRCGETRPAQGASSEPAPNGSDHITCRSAKRRESGLGGAPGTA